MGGQANVTDLALPLGFQQSLQSTAFLGDLLQLRHVGVVDLIQIDIIGLQITQADVDVLCHGLAGAGHTLGSQHELIPDALQRITQILFADGIAPGGVDVVDTGIHQLMHQLFGAFGVDALDGDAAQTNAGNFQSGFAQNTIFHRDSSIISNVSFIIARLSAENNVLRVYNPWTFMVQSSGKS